MHPRSIVCRPLSPEELHACREVARCDRRFHSLYAEAVRMRVFIEKMCGRLDPEAVIGTDVLEAQMLGHVARLPADGPGQIRAKAVLFRCRPEADDNLAAMLMASLDADAARLGLGPVGPIANGRIA